MTTTESDSVPSISLGRRRLIACAMTTAAAIQGMDTFATAVALPEIRGNMSATLDEAAWVLTSFLVASAIFTPLFAWLSKRFGQRRLLILITLGFLICTLLVAQATTLGELVFYRFMGVLPLQFKRGTTRKTLKLDGSETFDITGLEAGITPRMDVQCRITRSGGSQEDIPLTCRLDTAVEVDYYENGGMLHYILRQSLGAAA